MQNLHAAVKKNQSTPRTLTEALFNALGEVELYDHSTHVFEKHVGDYLAQKFGAAMLRLEHENPDAFAALAVLWTEITGKGPRR